MRFETFLLPTLRFVTKRPRLAQAVFRFDSWGNPFSPENAADPYPLVERAWKDGPVVYRRAYRRWFINGYDECQAIANHPSASAGTEIDEMFDDVVPYSRLSDQSKTFFRNWMLLQRGDEHARLRRLVIRTFTARRIAEFEPTIEATVREMLDAAEASAASAADGTVEMMAAFNRPLPVNVISTLLGIPAERHEWVGDIVADAATFLDPLNSFDPVRIDRAVEDLRTYVLDLAAERRSEPCDDLITALAQAEDEGDRLTEDELVANVGLLVFAGHDTTTNMLGNAIVALGRNPDQRRLVRENPELWPNAVEELLRYDTTAFAISRTVEDDIDLGETTIPAGSRVTLQLNSANRDPRRWDEPYELRLDRENPHPLSFGHGLHHCVGHALARMELRVALAAFADRFGDYELVEDELEWRQSVVLRGPTRLVIRPG